MLFYDIKNKIKPNSLGFKGYPIDNKAKQLWSISQ